MATLNNPGELAPDNFFYDEELHKVGLRLQDFARVAREQRLLEKMHPSAPMAHAYYHAIPVFGDRGGGKTTFIRTLIRHIESEEALSARMKPLDLIDPTIFERGTPFLTTVLVKINNIVKRKLSHEITGRRRYDSDKLHFRDDSPYTHDRDRYGRKELEEAVFELSGKFSVLLDGGIQESWRKHDAELLASELMTVAQDGLELGAAVHRFLEVATRLLGVDIIVLPIDDCDMLFSSSFEVLETVRKYLYSPFIVPVITGDADLFELVMMNQFYSDVKHLPKGDPLDIHIKTLAKQYRAKVLPSTHQVVLHPIVDYWSGHALAIRTTHLDFSSDPPDNRPKFEEVSRFFHRFLTTALNIRINIRDERNLIPRINPFAQLLPRNNRLLIAILNGMHQFLEGMETTAATPKQKGRIEMELAYDEVTLQWHFRDNLILLLEHYEYYLQAFNLTAEIMTYFYATSSEHRLTRLMLLDWNMNSDLFSLPGVYDEPVDQPRQWGILSTLLHIVYSRAIVDDPMRIWHFMLLPCDVTNYPGSSEQVVDSLGLRQENNLTAYMESYGELIYHQSGQESVITYDDQAEVYHPLVLLACQSRNLGDLFNPFRYLGLIGEIAIFLSQRQQRKGAPINRDELIAIFDARSEWVSEGSQTAIERYGKISSRLIDWFYWTRLHSVVPHFRPVSRVAALAMGRFRRMQMDEVEDHEQHLKEFIKCFLTALYHEEMLVLTEKGPTNSDPSVSNYCNKVWGTFDRYFQIKKSDEDSILNVTAPLTLTAIMACNPLVRDLLEETKDNERTSECVSA